MAARGLLGRTAAALALGLAAATAPAGESDSEGSNDASQGPSKSAPVPGDEVRSFYCRAVTGPLMNRSVCYVCRNGDRPVVMILARELPAGADALFRGVDRVVNENRAQGLRSFGVLLRDEPAAHVPLVQTFAFDHEIEMPLAVAPTAVAAAAGQDPDPGTALTVVLYRRQRVVSTHALRADGLTAEAVKDVLGSAAAFAGGSERSDDAPATE